MSNQSDLSLDQLVERERIAAEETAEATRLAADDTVTLPWWQHPLNIVTIVVTAAILAAMIGWMVGDAGGEPHNDVDTGFLQDMRTHHEQAVLMGFIYRNLPDTDPALRNVARLIVQGQNIEIGRMIQLLRDFDESEANETDSSMAWMGMVAGRESMPGMASDADLDTLGRSEGREADVLFVELMTAHHIGGIEMAEFTVENGQNAEVTTMAASMAAGQRSEIAEMEQLIADGS